VEAERMISVNLRSTNQAVAGILVVDSKRRIVSLNRKFIEMWHLPKHIVVSQDDNQALAFVSEQLETPKRFFAEVSKLYKQLHLEIHDAIDFKDGRRFERYSQPLWVEGENIGRMWSFRDITKSKKLKNIILPQKEFSLLLAEKCSFNFVQR
jgi:PAS domain-containing protein